MLRVHSCRRGFTIAELLVVVAIVGILVSLLLPAVQRVRESARRVQCLNHVKQHVLAILNFEDSNKHLPPGYTTPGMAMWSAFTLPYIEQGNLFDSVDIEGPWANATTNNANNRAALGVYISIFQCPSAGVAEVEFDPFIEADRVPSCYLACASGLIDRESGERPWCGMNEFEDLRASDGILYQNSDTAIADILDGQSNTMMIGEALPDQSVRGPDFSGNVQKVDHWYIGSGELVTYEELVGVESAECSECVGSTACSINAIKDPDSPIDSKELSFGSRHSGGVNAGFGDGHVRFVSELIEDSAWSAFGTRSHRDIAKK